MAGDAQMAGLEELDQQLRTDPSRTEGVTGIFEFVIGDLTWWIEANDGTGAVHVGSPEERDVTISMAEDVYAGIGSGEINGAQAFFDGLMTVEGRDQSKVMHLGQLFGE